MGTTRTFTPPDTNTNNQQTPIKMDSAKAAVKDFMSKSGQHDTTVHEKVAPAVKHETIQPVIQKQTIEPHVTHTTVPIHEVHHNAAQHHAASALPAVSMEEFKKSGGALSGREERTDGFVGEPKSAHTSTHGT